MMIRLINILMFTSEVIGLTSVFTRVHLFEHALHGRHVQIQKLRFSIFEFVEVLCELNQPTLGKRHIVKGSPASEAI